MKLSVQSSPIMNKFGVNKMCEVLKKAGFDGIDFNFDSYVTNQVIKEGLDCFLFHKDQTIEFAKELKKKLDEYGLEVLQAHSPFPSQFPLWNDETNKRMMDAQINSLYACQILGCHLLVVHPYFFGNATKPTTVEEEYEGNIRMYSTLIPYMRETNVTVCLENMWSQGKTKKIFQACCAEPLEANMYIDKLNEIAGEELFGFCCDTGHMTLVGLDPYKAIKTLGSRIKCFHIHDNDGIDDSHVIPGIGVTIWDRFYKAVNEIGYKGHLDFETANTQNKLFPDECLMLPSYTLIAEVGKMMSDKIQNYDK